MQGSSRPDECNSCRGVRTIFSNLGRETPAWDFSKE
jgi:hypothetical protein